jgi:hypothetical protein
MKLDISISRIAQIILSFDEDYIYDPEHKMRISQLPAGKKWFQTTRGWSTNPSAEKAQDPNAYETSKQKQIETKNSKITPIMAETEEAYKLSVSTGDKEASKKLIQKYAYELEKNIPRSSFVKGIFSQKSSEVLKNPSPTEIKQLREHDPNYGNVGVVISVSGNTYAFPREGNLHHEIARGLGIKEFTAIDLGRGTIEITPTTTQTMRETKEPFLMTEEAFPYIQPELIKDFYGRSIKNMKVNYDPVTKQGQHLMTLSERFL